MNGKVVGVALIGSGVLAGILMYWLQVFAFYEEVETGDFKVKLLPYGAEMPEEILAENVRAIDADSSPIRFRACFETSMSIALLTETYETYEDAVPLTAPGWFDCFDAESLGEALQSGEAIAFLGQKDVTYGIDRVVAITGSGQGYVWHQLSACGEAQFSGDPLPDGCDAPTARTED